jgi:hypothetical protein
VDMKGLCSYRHKHFSINGEEVGSTAYKFGERERRCICKGIEHIAVFGLVYLV